MNRNKLIKLLVSNLSNVIVHDILEKAIDKPEIANVYSKEMINSFTIAKADREKINPLDKILPINDANDMKKRIILNVNAELNLRISKGYLNIDLSLVEGLVDKYFKELRII
jgi:hypothetical protein